MPHGSRLPAARLPYGKTNPGAPTDRWCDGMLDIDYGGITHYLARNASSSDAIMFAIARSPVLDRSFFKARFVKIPRYAAPLSIQMRWFKSVCSTSKDCADKLGNALFLFGNVEANDMTIPLVQGKSIKEVQSYIPYVTKAQINAAGNDSSTYDDLGCLKNINDLIMLKNNDLQQAIENLRKEFPNTFTVYADFYNSMMSLIRETANSGPSPNIALQACCGIGGKYNYNNRKFCGTPGVPVCSNPKQYISQMRPTSVSRQLCKRQLLIV